MSKPNYFPHSPNFRPLEEWEAGKVREVVSSSAYLKRVTYGGPEFPICNLSYCVNGRFTTVLVDLIKPDGLKGQIFGSSLCGIRDEFDLVTGIALAADRAYTTLYRDFGGELD